MPDDAPGGVADAAEAPPNSVVRRLGDGVWRCEPSGMQRGIMRLLYAVVLVLALSQLSTPGGRGATLGFIGFAVVVAVFIETRIAQARVVMDARGVRIRNHFRSYDVAWDEIDEVQPLGTCSSLKLKDGRRLRMQGIARGAFGGDTRADAQEVFMIHLLVAHQAGTPV